MKIKTGFMLREIAGQWIVVPLGQRTVEFNAIMNLSETGALIWKSLERSEPQAEILKMITDAYDIDEESAETDYLEFMKLLNENGLVEQ